MAFFMCLECGEKNSNMWLKDTDVIKCNRCGWKRPPRTTGVKID